MYTHANADHHAPAPPKEENVMLNSVNIFLVRSVEILSQRAVSKIRTATFLV